jgi:hypothetical protein
VAVAAVVAPGSSTNSRWYASPLHPRLRTPTLISFGSGRSSSARSCSTAEGVSLMAALRARSCGRVRLGLAGAAVVAVDVDEDVAVAAVVFEASGGGVTAEEDVEVEGVEGEFEADGVAGGGGVAVAVEGGRVSCTLGRGSGMVIDVSGTSLFLGADWVAEFEGSEYA